MNYCAFQVDAFQNDAFQVCVSTEAAGWFLMHAPQRRLVQSDDDEEALLIWYFLEAMNG